MKSIAVVTGAQRGYWVVLCDVDEKGVRRAQTQIAGSVGMALDVTQFEKVGQVVATIEAVIRGRGPPDIP